MSDNVEMANDEGSDPGSGVKHQNPDGSSTADMVGKDDRHKTEKLAKARDPAVDPNIENPT